MSWRWRQAGLQRAGSCSFTEAGSCWRQHGACTKTLPSLWQPHVLVLRPGFFVYSSRCFTLFPLVADYIRMFYLQFQKGTRLREARELKGRQAGSRIRNEARTSRIRSADRTGGTVKTPVWQGGQRS